MIDKNDLVNLIVSLAKEVENEDPIDWGMLPVSEDIAYETMAMSIVDHFIEKDLEKSAESFSERELSMMASITKLVVENFVLHLQIENLRGN